MPKKNAHQLVVHFTGGLEYLTGLPARDMTLAEWESYPDDLRAQGLTLGLYEILEPETPVEPLTPVEEGVA